METNKNTETSIIGKGKNTESLMVQKSRPLFGLWKSDFTLASFKLLDAYLSRINSRQPEQRTVIFEKGEIEKLLGVTQIKPQDLNNRLKNLFRPVDLAKNDAKKVHLISLFEESYAEQDDNGIWTATLTCTTSAMRYFFNIEDIGYLRYRLKSIINITSRYSYIMFTYLESNRFRRSWEIDLNELKIILNCNTEQTYSQFKRFNDLILKKCHKELNEKTACKYNYEAIKKGRTVVAIRFTLATLSAVETDYQEQIDLDMLDTDIDSELWVDALKVFGFTQEQLDELRAVLVTIPVHKLPQSAACPGNIDLMRYHYIDHKAKEITRRDSDKPIRNKYAYLLKIIKQDAQ